MAAARPSRSSNSRSRRPYGAIDPSVFRLKLPFGMRPLPSASAALRRSARPCRAPPRRARRPAAASCREAAAVDRAPGPVAVYGRAFELGRRARAARRRRPGRRPLEPPAVGVGRRAPRPRAGDAASGRWSGSRAAASPTPCSAACRGRSSKRWRGACERAAPLEARGLRKTYGELDAVAGVDVTVRPGDVYGYLGPNGAGKTTSLRMMLGLIRPDGGRGAALRPRPDARPGRRAEGSPGSSRSPRSTRIWRGARTSSCWRRSTAATASAHRRASRGWSSSTSRADDRVRGYSHGMRQRLGLAGALLRGPRLLLLDEPTTGLDPAGMRDMRELVSRLAGEGITVLLSTHLMGEVEQLCNRLAIIQLGRIRYEGSLADLLARSDGRYRLDATDARRALGHLPRDRRHPRRHRRRRLRAVRGRAARPPRPCRFGWPRRGSACARSCPAGGASRSSSSRSPRARRDDRAGVFLGGAQARGSAADVPRPRRRGRRAGHPRGRDRGPPARSRPTRARRSSCALRSSPGSPCRS